jgi:lysozyme family protein
VKDNFEKCLEFVLHHEGGFVDHPEDPGGATNLGCTKATWEKWVGRLCTVDDIKALVPADVAPLYKDKYWDKVRGDDLPTGVDYCVFDTAINSGPGRAAKFLQEAVGAVADGAIGPRTLAAVREADPRQVIDAYCAARLAWLQELPTWPTFGRGWGRRVTEVRRQALLMLMV